MPLPLTVYKGDAPVFGMVATSRSGRSTVPLNLTGQTIYFTAKDDPEKLDANALVQKTTTHTDAANGKTELAFTSLETSAWATGRYYFDIKLFDATGKPRTLYVGTMEVLQPVTHRVTP